VGDSQAKKSRKSSRASSGDDIETMMHTRTSTTTKRRYSNGEQ
jgi:hypothetical protein